MHIRRTHVLAFVVGAILLLGGLTLQRGRAQQNEPDAPFVFALGNQISVYYPAQKKIYVYTELGGNCLYAYTLSTPGGRIARENCK